MAKQADKPLLWFGVFVCVVLELFALFSYFVSKEKDGSNYFDSFDIAMEAGVLELISKVIFLLATPVLVVLLASLWKARNKHGQTS